jgi:serine/threonine protein kinase
MANAKKKIKVFDGRYEILSIVGRGSASVVYHARHLSNPDQQVALKVLVAKNQLMPRSDLLRKEALAMVSARHQYVIRLDDFYSVGELCYLAMEFAPFGDLRRYIQGTGGTLLIPQAKTFLMQTAEALEFIHNAGILHRDMKPDNILVMSPKGIRLGDFGVSLLPGEESSLSELQRGVGTLNYMAPEVLDGVRYDQRCDLYALGVSFYEMLSGVHPFENASLIDQLKIRQDGNFAPLSTLVPEIPASLNTAIMELMRYNPDDRIPNAGVLRDILSSRGQNLHAVKSPSPTFNRMREIHAKRVNVSPNKETVQEDRENVSSPAQLSGSSAVEGTEQSLGNAALQSSDPRTHSDPRQSSQKATPLSQRPRIAPMPGMHQTREKEGEKVTSNRTVPPSAQRSTRAQYKEPALEQTAVLSAEQARNLAAGALASEPTPSEHRQKINRSNAAQKLGAAPSTSLPPDRQLPAAQNSSNAAQPPRNVSTNHDPAQNGRQRLSRKQLLRRAPALIVFGVIATLIIFMMSNKPQRIPTTQPDTGLALEATLEADPLYAQMTPADTALVFPDLPNGTFSGTMHGLFGRESTSILMISRDEEITLLIGESGMAPRSIKRSEITAERPILEFALGGHLLHLSGVVVDAELIAGNFRNLVTGEEGSWQISPATIHLTSLEIDLNTNELEDSGAEPIETQADDLAIQDVDAPLLEPLDAAEEVKPISENQALVELPADTLSDTRPATRAAESQSRTTSNDPVLQEEQSTPGATQSADPVELGPVSRDSQQLSLLDRSSSEAALLNVADFHLDYYPSTNFESTNRSHVERTNNGRRS